MGVEILGCTAGVLISVLLVGGRAVAPHLVDDDGKPFRLRFTPLPFYSRPSIGPHPGFAPSNRSLATSESLVPVPPWTFSELMPGSIGPEPPLLLDVAFSLETPPGEAQ